MKKFIQSLIALSAIALAATFSSCDSWINDEEGDCSVHYHIPFTYTQNILNTDAFSSQVTSVTLYAFNSANQLVLTKTESGDALATPGYTMDVDLKPGKYSLVVWAQGTPTYSDPTSFQIGTGNSITDLTATLPLVLSVGDPDPDARCSKDIVPLFHGLMTDVDFPDTYGDITLPAIDLTKDTNIFNIVLESVEGNSIESKDFTVSIVAANNVLSYTNNVISTEQFSYRPWATTQLSAQKADRASNPVNGLMAELTVGRLLVDRNPHLVIHRNIDNEDIVDLDLVQLLCMVKGHYAGNLTDQQYLDRMDFHRLVFFIGNGLSWYTAGGININGWKVVPPQNNEL